MELLGFDSAVLPEVTLAGTSVFTVPRKNIDRVTDECVIYLVTSGELFFAEGDREYRLAEGDFFAFEPGIRHRGTQSTVYTLVYLNFRHPGLKKTKLPDADPLRVREAYSSDALLFPKQLSLSAPEDCLGARELALRAAGIFSRPDPNRRLLSGCALCEFLAFISSRLASSGAAGRGETALAAKVMDHLVKNSSRRLTGALLESELRYNFDYLNQVFRRTYGTTVFAQLERLRIENAKNAIRTTDLPFGQIAVSVGYDNGSYFSKVFKKSVGCTPSAFRKRSKTL